MRLLIPVISLGLLGAFMVKAADTVELNQKEIVTYYLDDSKTFPINTYLSRGVTTVMFPGSIEGIAAANVAMNEVHFDVTGKPSSDFLMSFQNGNYYFSIRALKEKAEGSVNIVYGRKTYILKFKENELAAMGTVTFSSDSGTEGEVPKYVPPSIAVLKGLLDKAKSYDVLKKNFPLAVSNVTVCENKCIADYISYTATVVRTWRFNSYDSLVFMVELKNSTESDLKYIPKEIAVSVGNEKLYPALIDASGVMPKGSTTVAFLVVSATPDGRRNKYDAENEWKVLINAKAPESLEVKIQND